MGGEAEAEGDVGGELDVGGVAVVAGLVGEVAGGDGGGEEFGVTPGQVEGVLVIVVADAVATTDTLMSEPLTSCVAAR
jgi:hypothetical protein